MNKLFQDQVQPEYRTSDRFALHFTGATDIKLPFDGTVIVPRAAIADDASRLSAIQHLNHHDWIFYSLLHPRAARSEELGLTAVFPSLRKIDNQPFGLNSASRGVNGKVIVLAAKGHTLLDDLDSRAVFDDTRRFYSPRYPENASLSSLPHYLVIHLDNEGGNLSLPHAAPPSPEEGDGSGGDPSGGPDPSGGEPDGDTATIAFPPVSRSEGFSLLSDDHVTENLKNALAGGTFAGEIYGFDLAGNIIDGYALAMALGFEIISTDGSGFVPQPGRMLVQLVDLHGAPLDPDGDTQFGLTFEPPLVSLDHGELEAEHVRRVQFSDPAAPDLAVRFSFDDAGVAGSPEAERYTRRHIRVGLWPGFGHRLKALKPDGPVVLKLAEGFETPGTMPPFVRLCVLHPGDEFQTTAGGALDAEGVHEDNKFRLYTEANRVTVFNSGEEYFADLYEELEDGLFDELEGVYLTNWRSQPNVFMHGAMVAHGIERNDANSGTLRETVERLIDPATFFVAPLDPLRDPPAPEEGDPPEDPSAVKRDYVLLTRRTADASDQSFQMYIEELGDPDSVYPFSPIHRGFVRADGPAAWRLTGDGHGPYPEFRFSASWKTNVGSVKVEKNTLPLPPPTASPTGLMRFPVNALALGIDGEDPPGATLRQSVSYDKLLDLLVEDTANPDGTVNELAFDDAGRDLRIVFLHLQSGHYEVIPLDKTTQGNAQGSIDRVIFSFPRLFCTDEMALALVDWPADPDLLDLSSVLLTSWRRITYPVSAFERGALPLSTEELGGRLRQLIASKDIDLRALYWDHTQANLKSGLSLERGLSNSLAMNAVLNRSVDGRHGMSIIDRATRQMGSFHQKAVVLVKRDTTDSPLTEKQHRVVAYLGGIDLAHGRWDTEWHHHLDPERQNGDGWRDVQVKLEGDAALDVLKNFTQRWNALSAFHQDSYCRPVNVVAEMDRKIKVPKKLIDLGEPGPLVQITRTWPPASCHAKQPSEDAFVGPDGELGSLESYLKAIRKARKYILINDQYYFGLEIAQAMHEALLRPDGPDCAIIMLPMNLSEFPLVDPLIYKTRKRAFDTLFYGATLEDGGDPGPNHPHYYAVNPSTGLSLRDRVAIVTPINHHGEEVYVHSKQIIVDDVFMSIGSANFSVRGTTYEMEINAAIADPVLMQGGGTEVREQRIELCRRMLGLPKSYSALLQDWNACFNMFKAIETETAPTIETSPSAPGELSLHPLPPMVKHLPPAFQPRLGPSYTGYNQDLDFVLNMNNNSPGLLWFVRNAIDTDGRDTTTEDVLIRGLQLFSNIAYLNTDSPYLTEFPHSPPDPYGRVLFDMNALKDDIETIAASNQTPALIVTVQVDEVLEGPTELPFTTEIARHEVSLDNGRNVVIAEATGNQLLVPLHVDRAVTVIAKLGVEETTEEIGVGMHAFDPNTWDVADPSGPAITFGTFLDATLVLTRTEP